MKISHRLALIAWLALASSAGLSTASFAQGLAAQSARINALGSARKYDEAIPLAQALVASLDKGAPSRDLAGALNNLAQLYGDVGRDAEAEPLYMRALFGTPASEAFAERLVERLLKDE